MRPLIWAACPNTDFPEVCSARWSHPSIWASVRFFQDFVILDIDVPVFTIDYHRELEGSECIVAHIENGTITFTGNGQENQKKRYLNRAFMKFFFVSDASEASE